MNGGLEWQDRFNIGVDVIDKAHKQLFATMNRLLGLSEQKLKSRWICQEGIKYLKAHAVKHFAEEENYMKSIGYSGYEMHRRLHRNFRLKTLPALEQELEDTNYSTDAVRHFLGVCIGWMTGHTLTEDQAITGKIESRWENLSPEEEINALGKTIAKLTRKMFLLDTRVVNDHYDGEEFGEGIYYRVVYGAEREEVIFIFEDKLLEGTAGEMLGIRFQEVNDVVINATRYIAKQFLKQIRESVYSAKEQAIVEESLLTSEEFHEIFGKAHPNCSLLFGTDEGYFAFCRYESAPEDEEVGRAINARNAMGEIKKYLHNNDKKKILVVDDSGVIRQALKKLLEKDYEVVTADSGATAMKLMIPEKPDLVLMDYQMPDWDGLETLKSLRAEKKTANIPVIFLTGKADRRSIEKMMSARPAGYLLKTMRTADIKKNIDAFFSQK
ncbi:MAG: response regulator [Clostridium sp.]|nr:response regulator [Clostridium sp.]